MDSKFRIRLHFPGGIPGTDRALDPRDRAVGVAAQQRDDGGFVQHDGTGRIDFQRAANLVLRVVELAACVRGTRPSPRAYTRRSGLTDNATCAAETARA
jgi:hypothetical protein